MVEILRRLSLRLPGRVFTHVKVSLSMHEKTIKSTPEST